MSYNKFLLYPTSLDVKIESQSHKFTQLLGVFCSGYWDRTPMPTTKPSVERTLSQNSKPQTQCQPNFSHWRFVCEIQTGSFALWSITYMLLACGLSQNQKFMQLLCLVISNNNNNIRKQSIKYLKKLICIQKNHGYFLRCS